MYSGGPRVLGRLLLRKVRLPPDAGSLTFSVCFLEKNLREASSFHGLQDCAFSRERAQFLWRTYTQPCVQIVNILLKSLRFKAERKVAKRGAYLEINCKFSLKAGQPAGGSLCPGIRRKTDESALSPYLLTATRILYENSVAQNM